MSTLPQWLKPVRSEMWERLISTAKRINGQYRDEYRNPNAGQADIAVVILHVENELQSLRDRITELENGRPDRHR